MLLLINFPQNKYSYKYFLSAGKCICITPTRTLGKIFKKIISSFSFIFDLWSHRLVPNMQDNWESYKFRPVAVPGGSDDGCSCERGSDKDIPGYFPQPGRWTAVSSRLCQVKSQVLIPVKRNHAIDIFPVGLFWIMCILGVGLNILGSPKIATRRLYCELFGNGFMRGICARASL